MLVAELEAYTSRPIAPTRRVALGRVELPTDPAPGFGGILLGGVIARFAPELEDEMLEQLEGLMGEIEAGRRIAQPRLRHRFQQDRIGLLLSSHRLLAEGERLEFDIDDERGTPAHHVLAAVYAAARVPIGARRSAVLATMRRGLRWRGGMGPELVGHLAGRSRGAATAVGDPLTWALTILDLRGGGRPSRGEVQRAFRDRLREAHPDHGGVEAQAAARISELNEARRILLG